MKAHPSEDERCKSMQLEQKWRCHEDRRYQARRFTRPANGRCDVARSRAPRLDDRLSLAQKPRYPVLTHTGYKAEHEQRTTFQTSTMPRGARPPHFRPAAIPSYMRIARCHPVRDVVEGDPTPTFSGEHRRSSSHEGVRQRHQGVRESRSSFA